MRGRDAHPQGAGAREEGRTRPHAARPPSGKDPAARARNTCTQAARRALQREAVGGQVPLGIRAKPPRRQERVCCKARLTRIALLVLLLMVFHLPRCHTRDVQEETFANAPSAHVPQWPQLSSSPLGVSEACFACGLVLLPVLPGPPRQSEHPCQAACLHLRSLARHVPCAHNNKVSFPRQLFYVLALTVGIFVGGQLRAWAAARATPWSCRSTASSGRRPCRGNRRSRRSEART